ncbi:MAG: hypothetical protein Q9219_007464 [cf. Caloplaca sp. 3 TL-2023]
MISLTLCYAFFLLAHALPQIAMDSTGFDLTCRGTPEDFNKAIERKDLCTESSLVDCCHNIAFLNCRAKNTFTSSAMGGLGNPFCRDQCSCTSNGQDPAQLGSDGPGTGTLRQSGSTEGGDPAAGNSTNVPPQGFTCQEWNRRVAANPLLATEVAPKIPDCPPK